MTLWRRVTSEFTSENSSTGISASYNLGTQQASGSFSRSDGNMDGSFVSAQEQSGIYTKEGYDITVRGDAVNNAGVIASEAAPEFNRFVAESYEANDLLNEESYDARQTAFSVGTGGVDLSGQKSDGNNQIPGTGGAGFGVPNFFNADGEQSGVTRAAIDPGTFIIGGEDLSNDPSINRDTAGANDGALTQEFTDETRQEITDNFDAARILAAESNTAFQNLARKEAEKDAEAEQAEKDAEAAGAVRGDDGELKAPEGPEGEEARKYIAQAKKLRGEAQDLRDTFGLPTSTSMTGSQESTSYGGVSDNIALEIGGVAADKSDDIFIDTANAANALEREFNADKREEFAQGEAAIRALNSEVVTFLNNRAEEAQEKKERGEDPGNAWGPGSLERQILMGLVAAASGDLNGSLTDLLQDATVSVLQQNLAEEVGRQVHDPNGAIEEGSAEQVILHALIGCAAGEASTGGSCGTGAAGQGGSALLTNLLKAPDDATAKEKEAYSRLVQNVVGGIGASASCYLSASMRQSVRNRTFSDIPLTAVQKLA